MVTQSLAARSALAPKAGSLAAPNLEADSIHVARLPEERVATDPRAIPKPPALTFVTEEARHTRVNLRPAVLIALVMMAAFPLALIEAGTPGHPSPSHKASIHLTLAERQAAAAARARAAAIALFKRDRGTDAQWEDTIPAATPPPTGAATAKLPKTPAH